MPGFTVQVEQLREWSGMVERSFEDMSAVWGYGNSNVSNTGFGPIMSLIDSAYGRLVPAVLDNLLAMSTGLFDESQALEGCANTYSGADARTRARLDGTVPAEPDPVPELKPNQRTGGVYAE